ncbi:ABC transporter ATP-binding protein [Vallitalea sp.]|jgi:putative ABC transport system ATP-binding protein|uniref:ABC transporter ATP-binding protein n=1 Tax=Vallitalea sp. TaxID=1882829 RepID=UPI0025E60C5A|nr:ABC transporter ATP-binding protein [Vallitalea sp.]MCT4685976.1 ABC transporter ATP-binding protein [Vallitalea sp.]
MKQIIKVSNVTKVYGSKLNKTTALVDINFEINQGEFVGIMGPSGSGKSTLLNVISTIDRTTSGTISYEGKDISSLKENELSDFRRNELGFIFQDFNLLDTLSVEENIVLPLAISRMNVKEIKRRLHDVTKILGINDILKKYPYEISGGQKQRTAAARAIINNPRLVLADEPTGALDSKSSAELLTCMKRLNKEYKSTILMVTHDAFAASYCDRILFIKDGNIFSELISNGDRKEFYNKVIDVLAMMGGDLNDIL